MKKAEKILKIIAITTGIIASLAIIVGIILCIAKPKKANAAIFTKSSANTISQKIYNINKIFSNEWGNKTWQGMTDFEGKYIWTANDTYYYSDTTKNLKLVSNTWVNISTFNEAIDGQDVWTDGTNVYYSQGTGQQYIFDTNTETWNNMEWQGYQDIYGQMIWIRSGEIFFSNGADNFKLNGNLWELFEDFTSEQPINGNQVYSDGESYYYSNTDINMYLEYYTWVIKPTDQQIDGNNVWTDGTNLYYSEQGIQLRYNQAQNTWEEQIWDGFIPTLAQEIWTDGTNIYYSEGTEQWILKEETTTYTITVNVSNGTKEGNTEIGKNGNANIKITPNNGYKLPETITVRNANYTYNPNNGIIALSNPTTNVTITAICIIKPTFNITININNGYYTGQTNIEIDGTQTITIYPNAGYELPNTITVQNANYSYNIQTGIIILNKPTSNVTISANCVAREIFNIYTEITNGRINGATQINKTGSVTLQIIPNTNYLTPTTINVNGAEYTYNTNGIITITKPIDDVRITATCLSVNPQDRYEQGYDIGYGEGLQQGQQTGYNKGYTEGVNDAGNYTFSSLVDSVAFVPIKTLYSILNFEILGINVFGFFVALLTIGFVITMLKIFF